MNVIEEDTEEWQKDSTFSGLERVGGVDLSYVKGNDTIACASLVVLNYPDLEVMALERLGYLAKDSVMQRLCRKPRDPKGHRQRCLSITRLQRSI